MLIIQTVMFKYTCFIMLISVTSCLQAQSYNIATYNGLTVNTCSGNFYDSGGSGSNYGNNETYTVTFCSNSGDPLFFDFGATSSSLNLDAGTGDTLFFYDGLTTSGDLIATLTKSDDYGFSNPTVGTVSSCVTILWKSNGSAADGGWSATIDCTAPPVCDGNPPAADVFGQATAVCNLNDYCGTTSGYYGEDAPYNFGGTGGSCPHPDDDLFAGTLENNSWLKFVADGTSATFDYNVTGGASCDGVQIGIYAFNEATETFTLKSPCSYTDGGHEGAFSITATSLTIGDTYYMMIDGNSGSNCDYTIGAGTGVATVDAGVDQSICGASATLDATLFTGSGEWTLVSGSGVFADAADPNSWVSGLSLGDNVFQWTTTDGLCSDGYDMVTINNTCLLPLELTAFSGNSNNGKVNLNWTTANEINTSHFEVERATNNQVFVGIATVNAQGVSTSNLNYVYEDTYANSGINYYRLKQVDADGNFQYSDIIAVQHVNQFNNTAAIDCYFDASNTTFYFNGLPENGVYDVMLFDISGAALFKTTIYAQQDGTCNIDLQQSPNCMFGILQITGRDVMYITKMYFPK